MNHFKHKHMTFQEEATIRRAFFIEHMTPNEIYGRFHISESKLRSLIGGPLVSKRGAIESVYN